MGLHNLKKYFIQKAVNIKWIHFANEIIQAIAGKDVCAKFEGNRERIATTVLEGGCIRKTTQNVSGDQDWRTVKIPGGHLNPPLFT